ncbi:hypothetical protein [Thiocystis violascens]|uniref:Uncharacterized protein n=1 Tax=Thiocystis violascens (strain ATCC 17096 / DSM 198 / 6111) TaxID=765911 RepID=I3YEG2_THIV6|nr:hypothetical protein [Thiocystis violascens]AFL75380.1 hypothetical protein Thivi_3513 [Thiocystis violascens DSM 198]
MTIAEHLSPDDVNAAFRAVADLLAPERDLSVVNRDELGTLLRLLCLVREHLERA